MAIDKDLLDRLLAGRDARELFGSGGLLDELKKALSGTVGSFVHFLLHLVYEPFAEDDGELRFSYDPFTRRPFPFLCQVIEHEV